MTTSTQPENETGTAHAFLDSAMAEMIQCGLCGRTHDAAIRCDDVSISCLCCGRWLSPGEECHVVEAGADGDRYLIYRPLCFSCGIRISDGEQRVFDPVSKFESEPEFELETKAYRKPWGLRRIFSGERLGVLLGLGLAGVIVVGTLAMICVAIVVDWAHSLRNNKKERTDI